MGRKLGRKNRRLDERGVSLTETAITMPLVLLLIFGSMEFGLAFRNYLTVSNAARDAARFASILGATIDSDYQVLQELRANLGDQDINQVIIFKATNTDSTIEKGALAQCRFGSVYGLCNTYTGSEIEAEFDDFGCGPSSPDQPWCPDTRNTLLSDPPDYVGVFVEISHPGLTGMFAMGRNFSEEVVMRMEPIKL